MLIKIKPLSVNDAWKGQRFKTTAYKHYEQLLGLLLRPLTIPEGKLKLTLIWAFSSAGSDIDNPCKPCIDILQKKYGFNDSRIHKLDLEKTKVKKGDEFIYLLIDPYQESPELAALLASLNKI